MKSLIFFALSSRILRLIKSVIYLFLVIFSTSTLFAQNPTKNSYQIIPKDDLAESDYITTNQILPQNSEAIYPAQNQENSQGINSEQQGVIANDQEVNSSKPENPRSAIFLPKIPTPNRMFSADLSKPEVFVNSNDLIKKSGSFYQARGEVISLEGRVTDSFGVPISGAIIEIWQTNSAGKYQNLLEKNSKFLDVYFNMSGKAVTDNLGYYNFLTILPGSYLERAPHININIYHQDFGKIETELYFQDHPKNEFDYEYLSYNDEERKLLTARVELSDVFDATSMKKYFFDIFMNGVHKYKGFAN